MNEERENEFTIDESKVKDALVALSQQKVAELNQQNLILQANYQVVLAERVQMPELIKENEQLQKTIDEFSRKNTFLKSTIPTPETLKWGPKTQTLNLILKTSKT